MLDEDRKLLENYVAVEKEKVLAEKISYEDVSMDLIEIINTFTTDHLLPSADTGLIIYAVLTPAA